MTNEYDYYKQFFNKGTKLGKAGKALGWAGNLINGVTASASSMDYSASNTFLSSKRRLNNESMVWDVEFVIGTVGILPPISDFLKRFVYEENPETNISLFDQLADIRYEVFGKQGW